jgi:hypothetical protein
MKKKLILLTIFTQEIKLLNIDLTKKIASKISNTTAELIENPITKFYKDLQEVGQLLSLGEALIQNHLKAFLMLLDMGLSAKRISNILSNYESWKTIGENEQKKFGDFFIEEVSNMPKKIKKMLSDTPSKYKKKLNDLYNFPIKTLSGNMNQEEEQEVIKFLKDTKIQKDNSTIKIFSDEKTFNSYENFKKYFLIKFPFLQKSINETSEIEKERNDIRNKFSKLKLDKIEIQ